MEYLALKIEYLWIVGQNTFMCWGKPLFFVQFYKGLSDFLFASLGDKEIYVKRKEPAIAAMHGPHNLVRFDD